MEEILRKINQLNEFLTEENLAKMTPEERTRYLNSVEDLEVKLRTLIKLVEGGND